MTDLQKIMNDIDDHIKSISDLNKNQMNLVDELVSKNEKDIEAYQAFNDADEINEKVASMIQKVTDELDSAVKDIKDRIKVGDMK
ncbi:hypothetical protein [Agarilytica rhodophyticola]|uniref:hypothetical protein n=1 Tax=Agarilytica rhodophyticola TaxID=1737490 RepID=UPI000B348328|nr:hypothetical protein [Agarilytica rhodophyticola]